MKDINFYIENIKRSIDAIADMTSNKELSDAIMELIEYPNFQTLFNLKLQSKLIHERELCELIGLKRGSLDIADQVFQYNDHWGMTQSGDFTVEVSPGRGRGAPQYPFHLFNTFVFRIVEADDDTDIASGIKTWVVGIMKPGEDMVYKVKFLTHPDMGVGALVDALRKLAPDFKVFATKL